MLSSNTIRILRDYKFRDYISQVRKHKLNYAILYKKRTSLKIKEIDLSGRRKDYLTGKPLSTKMYFTTKAVMFTLQFLAPLSSWGFVC